MATTGRSTVVGVFTERAQVDLAVEELERAGFNNDQIKFIEPDAGQRDPGIQRNLIGAINRVFSGQETTGGSIVKDLVNMGVPEEEAGYYQHEFEVGRSIVAVEAAGRREQALEILRQNGAYDATTRPETHDPNASPGTGNPPTTLR